jgi:hypothetical protein
LPAAPRNDVHAPDDRLVDAAWRRGARETGHSHKAGPSWAPRSTDWLGLSENGRARRPGGEPVLFGRRAESERVTV